MQAAKEKLKPVIIDAKLVSKRQLTYDVMELLFESSLPFVFAPGQFISILIPGAGPGGRDLRRAYSIASAPEMMTEKRCFELCIKLVEGGPGTSYLNGMKTGDVLKGHVPFGDFIYKTRDRHVIFIATGTGIAPFRSMIFSKEFSDHRPLSTKLLFGARDTDDLLYTDELKPLLSADLVQTLSRPERSWPGFKGRVTDWLRENSTTMDWTHTEFYLCGNGAMIDEVKKILMDQGVAKDHIHQEIYYKPKN